MSTKFYPPRPFRPHERCGSGFGSAIKKLFFFLVLVPVVAGVVFMTAPSQSRVVAPPLPEPMGRMSPRTLQNHAAMNGIVGGASAGQQALAGMPDSTRANFVSATVLVPPASVAPRELVKASRSRTAIRLAGVRSELPHNTKERATADALEVAQKLLAEQLRQLDPPITAVPEIWEIRDRYVRPGSTVEELPTQELKDEWAAAKLNPNRVWVKFDVEVSEDQLRQLRSEGRLMQGAGLGGLAFVLAGALCGFLRLDAYTKGYLTVGLGAGAAVVAVAAIAALALLG
jgi:hypothetical protein